MFDFAAMKSTVLTALLLGIVTPGHGAPEPAPEPQLAVFQQAASYCYVYTSTFLATATIGPPSTVTVTPPTTAGTSTQPSGTVALDPVIFSVVPLVGGTKRHLPKRDLGGFVNIGQPPNPQSCTDAYVFLIGGGQLIAEGEPIFTEPDVNYLPLTSFGTPPQGAITKYFTWADGYLHWYNIAFGSAGFCQVPSTGQVYITFTASQADRPEGCVSVLLKVFAAAQCQNGEIIGQPTSTMSRPSNPTTSPSNGVTSSQFTYYTNSTTNQGTASTSLPESFTTSSAPEPNSETSSSAITPPPYKTSSSTTPSGPPDESTSSSEPTPPPNESTSSSKPTPPPSESTSSSEPTPPPSESTSSSEPTPPPSESTSSSEPTPPPNESTSSSEPTPPPSESTSSSEPTPPPNKSTSSSEPTPPPNESTSSSEPTPPPNESTSSSAPTPPPNESTSSSEPTPPPNESTSSSAPTPPPNESTSSFDPTSTFGSSYTTSSTSSLASATSAFCPFPFSNAIIPDGGFEDGQDFFNLVTSIGVGSATPRVIPAVNLPVFLADACIYSLEIDVSGVTTTYLSFQFDAVAGAEYTASFEALACGNGLGAVAFTVGIGLTDLTIGANLFTGSTGLLGGCSTWNRYSVPFTADTANFLNVLVISAVPLADAQLYFDNFMVTPANGQATTTQPSGITGGPVPTQASGTTGGQVPTQASGVTGGPSSTASSTPSTLQCNIRSPLSVQSLLAVLNTFTGIEFGSYAACSVQCNLDPRCLSFVYSSLFQGSVQPVCLTLSQSLAGLDATLDPLSLFIFSDKGCSGLTNSTSSACPFTLSASIFPDGGFEAGFGVNPFTYTQVSGTGIFGSLVENLAGLSLQGLTLLPGNCDYTYLVYVAVPGANTVGRFTSPSLPVAVLSVYNVQFDLLACGGVVGEDSWSVLVGGTVVASDNTFLCTWKHYTGTFFSGSSSSEVLTIQVATGALGSAEYLFDNFVITVA